MQFRDATVFSEIVVDMLDGGAARVQTHAIEAGESLTGKGAVDAAGHQHRKYDAS
jgi:hypothetical protein